MFSSESVHIINQAPEDGEAVIEEDKETGPDTTMLRSRENPDDTATFLVRRKPNVEESDLEFRLKPPAEAENSTTLSRPESEAKPGTSFPKPGSSPHAADLQPEEPSVEATAAIENAETVNTGEAVPGEISSPGPSEITTLTPAKTTIDTIQPSQPEPEGEPEARREPLEPQPASEIPAALGSTAIEASQTGKPDQTPDSPPSEDPADPPAPETPTPAQGSGQGQQPPPPPTTKASPERPDDHDESSESSETALPSTEDQPESATENSLKISLDLVPVHPEEPTHVQFSTEIAHPFERPAATEQGEQAATPFEQVLDQIRQNGATEVVGEITTASGAVLRCEVTTTPHEARPELRVMVADKKELLQGSDMPPRLQASYSPATESMEVGGQTQQDGIYHPEMGPDTTDTFTRAALNFYEGLGLDVQSITTVWEGREHPELIEFMEALRRTSAPLASLSQTPLGKFCASLGFYPSKATLYEGKVGSPYISVEFSRNEVDESAGLDAWFGPQP